MTSEYTRDYLLNKRVKIFQPVDGYRASTDAVMLSAMVDEVKNAKILDVGSGTGAISLCLAQRLGNSGIHIDGLELQSELAELANMSAKENGFDSLKFYNCDIKNPQTAKEFLPCSYDIVVTNPPYSDHDMPSPNFGKATAHNLSDMDLAQWLKFCIKMTKPFGKIYIINRVEALPLICSEFSGKAGNITILPLYSKKGQNAKRIIVCAQKDSKAPSRILPPFCIHNADGSYSPNAEKVLREGCSLAEIE
jgi:tRNA1(Val) A37 N6-methylase TrmN6